MSAPYAIPSRRDLYRAFPLLAIFFLVLLVAKSDGSTGSRKSGKSSVFSLFNLKAKSRFWSETVIRGDFNDLEASRPGKANAYNYTKAGNVANYLKLLEVDSLYLPVPVNFIFIGFEGKGNHEFKLNAEELERWFMKIDHIFEHTRLPQIGEVLTPFYKINVNKEHHYHLPSVSHINYNFSVHAIQMGEKVTSVFEHAIDVLSRRDDISDIRDDQAGVWQVDVDMIDTIFTSLVEYLELGDAYNVFILNPKRDAKKAKYGYRRGLSDSEIKFLKENKDLQDRILQSGRAQESVLGAFDKIKRPLYEKHPMTKFAWTISEDTDTIEWYNICQDVLNNVGTSNQGKDTSDIIKSKVLQLLNGKDEDLKIFLEKMFKSGDFSGLHEECLTDTWIGKNRWAFIDLSAGPFSWGPAVGGEGVRTELSLPNVGKTIGAVAGDITIEGDAEILLNQISGRLDGNFEDRSYIHDIIDRIKEKAKFINSTHWKWIPRDLNTRAHKLADFGDISIEGDAEILLNQISGRLDGNFEDRSYIHDIIDQIKEKAKFFNSTHWKWIPRDLNTRAHKLAEFEISEDEAEDRLQEAIQEKFAVFGDKDHQAIDILLAEIDIYELFAFKHCKGRKVKLALCDELDERMQDLKNELQSFEGEEYDENHKRKAVDALKRMESWNLFTDTQEEFQNYTVARDAFLAHLGATLWGSMRHIIAPSIADGSFHFYDKISFQLFFITQEKVKHTKQLPIDLKPLMNGLSSLLLPSQKAAFSTHILPLSEDPALAMAFSVARRAAAVPELLVNGTYKKTVRSYLDSSILQHQLQRLNDHGSLKGSHAHSRSTLEVPIFWFIHDDPLLVDKHYQAKALSDMVIVVQSDSSSWESHLQCNGHSLLWDLRRPIKSALAAVAEHLGGLVPLHLVYSHAHETAIEDWIWSVGCNPLSVTSQGWHISQFQSDTIARSYILTALEESIKLVNSAIHLLVLERTSEKTFKLFQHHELELVDRYSSVVGLWRRISTSSGEVRYVDALRLLHSLEESTKRFTDYANATLADLRPLHCTTERKVGIEFDMTTIPAFLVVVGVLWIVLRPRRPKPKIN